jgi:hypothetical protein
LHRIIESGEVTTIPDILGIGEKSMNFMERFMSFVKDEKKAKIFLGRNDICWCGSGKKYKKCHLEADEEKRRKKAM